VTALVGREIVFSLASLGAVMQLKCGSTALGIARNFNSLNTEDEVLAFRILRESAKISAYSPWKPLPSIRLFSVPLPSAAMGKQCGVTESCPCLVRRSSEVSVSRQGTVESEDGQPLEVKLTRIRVTDAERSPAVP